MTPHELSDDAKLAKQRELGRLWLNQLASLMHDFGFRTAFVRLEGARGCRIVMRRPVRFKVEEELTLCTCNQGRTWSARLGTMKTGGTIRLTTDSLGAAQTRIFGRLVKPLR